MMDLEKKGGIIYCWPTIFELFSQNYELKMWLNTEINLLATFPWNEVLKGPDDCNDCEKERSSRDDMPQSHAMQDEVPEPTSAGSVRQLNDVQTADMTCFDIPWCRWHWPFSSKLFKIWICAFKVAQKLAEQSDNERYVHNFS